MENNIMDVITECCKITLKSAFESDTELMETIHLETATLWYALIMKGIITKDEMNKFHQEMEKQIKEEKEEKNEK